MKINRTVQRTIEILTYIAAHPAGVTLEELCQTFSLPKTSAYDILVTLTHSQMLSVKPGPRQLYRIGISAYRIGMSYPNSSDDLKMIASFLKELAAATDRTAFFGKLAGDQVLYLLKELPPNPIITTATVGSTAPLYCTSLGKTLLANLPEEEQQALLTNLTFVPRTEATILTPEAFAAELEQTKVRGYALDMREYEDHMACVSAPVFGKDGLLLGAISVSGIYQPATDYQALGQFMETQARDLSRLLGCHS